MREAISLGLDLGTSALKAVLLDEQGQVRASAESALTVSRPNPGWSEQDPAQWWEAACTAMSTLRSAHPELWSQVVCIGLSGQMHGLVLLDEDNAPLRPAILHNDGRAQLQSQMLATGVPDIAEITGSRPMAGLTAAKLLWMKWHEPEWVARAACLLSPKDFLGLQLTGQRLTDASDAAGTQCFDVRTRQWSDAVLQAIGLPRRLFPTVLESSQSRGEIDREVAAGLGLSPRVQVAAGGGDTPVSGLGIGATQLGSSFLNLSTSASAVVVVDHPQLDAAASIHALSHAAPGVNYQMGAMLSGASCLRWAAHTMNTRSEADLVELVQARFARQADLRRRVLEAPLFLPYLSGERTPHNDASARGVFFGMTHASHTADMGYAVLEGVAFGLRDALAAIESTGTRVGLPAIVGGGARSSFWADLIASVLARPVRRVRGSEMGAAIGAARLGWMAVGKPMAEVCTEAPTASLHAPDDTLRDVLDERYQQFRELYQSLSHMFEVRARRLNAALQMTHAALEPQARPIGTNG